MTKTVTPNTNGSTDSLRDTVMENLKLLAEDPAYAHVATLVHELVRRYDNGARAAQASIQAYQAAIDAERLPRQVLDWQNRAA